MPASAGHAAAPASPPDSTNLPPAIASLSAVSPDTQSSTDAANRVVKRRAPVACRRCRRMRSKCIHNGTRPPCEGCRIAGVSLDECVFPSRGAPDLDREYRHPRMRGDKARKEGANAFRSGSAGLPPFPPDLGPDGGSNATDPWDLLPQLDLIIDAVNMFTYQYFQLGFIPRDTFAEHLRNDPRSVSPFLLFSVLSVSGRLTDSLVTAYGDAETASELFMSRASAMALTELYEEPTLARCQAFYLLSLAQQGSGYKNKSYLNLGIAIRMALLMQLHREETYALEDPTPNMVREAESARRTLWMLYSQDNLHAAPSAPVSLAASDITTLLPSNEDDFAKGVLPKTRAALEDTQPAIEDPYLARVPERSLFATLIQSHRLWGIVSRRAIRNDRCIDPWSDTSDYAQIQKPLSEWEAQLPPDHRWSLELFKKSKSEAYDLAYLIVTMVTRLCNIIIRKAYLPNMLQQGGNSSNGKFWSEMSLDLFTNVKELFTQIDVWFQERRPGDSTGAQMAIFCVYSCGLMSAYLCKYPHVCRRFAPEGQHMFERTLDILAQSKTVWPLARRWLGSLDKFLGADLKNSSMVSNHFEGSMAEGKDPIPSALHPPLTASKQSGPPTTPLDDRQYVAKQLRPDSPHVRPSGPGSISNSSNTAQRLPPQLRTNDSLLNGRLPLPLPLPHPSPVLVTTTITAAPHYSTAHYPHSQPAQLVPQQHQLQYQHHHQPPSQGLSSVAPQPAAPTPLPQMLTHPQPKSPMHLMPDGPVTGLATIGATANADASSTGAPAITSTLPSLTPALSPAIASAAAHNNIDLLVRAFDTSSSSQVPLAHGNTPYSQLPPQVLLPVGTTPTQYYGQSYPVPFNDGFENELAFMMVGSEASAATPWAPSFFRY